MYECVYTKRSKNTNEILPNHSRQLSPLQILPRRTRRSPKARKLTREAGGKIVRPTFRLLRCYGGETTKEPRPASKTTHAARQPPYSFAIAKSTINFSFDNFN